MDPNLKSLANIENEANQMSERPRGVNQIQMDEEEYEMQDGFDDIDEMQINNDEVKKQVHKFYKSLQASRMQNMKNTVVNVKKLNKSEMILKS